jgi:hypothetical protein
MGRRGPLPKPTAMRELEGDPGKLLHKRRREPKPKKVTGVYPPRWLGRFARDEWQRIVPELERLGLLTVIDLGALEIYCDLFGRWRVARVKRDNDRAVLELANRLKQYIAEFGLSPAGRVRIDADDPAMPAQPAVKPREEGQAAGRVVDASRFFGDPKR